jgi:hypothetical protein
VALPGHCNLATALPTAKEAVLHTADGIVSKSTADFSFVGAISLRCGHFCISNFCGQRPLPLLAKPTEA